MNIIEYIRQRLTNLGYCPNKSEFKFMTYFVAATSKEIAAGRAIYFYSEIETTENFVIKSSHDYMKSDNYLLANKMSNFVKEFTGNILITKSTAALQPFSFIVINPVLLPKDENIVSENLETEIYENNKKPLNLNEDE